MKGITLLPDGISVEDAVDNIIRLTLEKSKESKNNAVTFFSTISNIGTTSTCLSVAEALSESTTASIGVLLLNVWDKGTHQLEYNGSYLDSIKGKLTNRAIKSKEEFYDMFHHHENGSLYILGGNRHTKLERLYTKDEISYLIELSKEYFDVVLIDAGSHFDNAPMFQSLEDSDLRLLVINQQPKALDKFQEVYKEILNPIGYTKTDFATIVNRYINNAHFPTVKNLTEKLDIRNISTIAEFDDPLFSEMEMKTLYQIDDPLYNDSVNRIVESVIHHVGIDLKDNRNKKRKRWFKF